MSNLYLNHYAQAAFLRVLNERHPEKRIEIGDINPILRECLGEVVKVVEACVEQRVLDSCITHLFVSYEVPSDMSANREMIARLERVKCMNALEALRDQVIVDAPASVS